jgi:sulfoxide reductase heme-binding subunit YedZ
MSQIDLWYATRATGVMALLLLSATVVLGILVAGRAQGSLPGFARTDIHRRVSILAVVFLAIHILTSVLDSYVHIGWLAIVVPFTASYHRDWLALGTVGTDLLLAVAISSALRARIPARVWRAVHWLAYFSWPSAISHTLGMGTDAKFAWVQGLVALCIALVLGTGSWRAVSALRAHRDRPVTTMSVRRSLRLSMRKDI